MTHSQLVHVLLADLLKGGIALSIVGVIAEAIALWTSIRSHRP